MQPQPSLMRTEHTAMLIHDIDYVPLSGIHGQSHVSSYCTHQRQPDVDTDHCLPWKDIGEDKDKKKKKKKGREDTLVHNTNTPHVT